MYGFLQGLQISSVISIKMLKRTELPTDLPKCHELILSLDWQKEHFKHQVEMLKRRLFGPSSEKRAGPEQPGLPFVDLPAAPPVPAALEHAAVVSPGKSKPEGHGRRKLPAHLPRQRREYHPAGIAQPCPCCGSAWERIGEEVSEQLEVIPAQFVVLQHARIKYACPKCKDRVVIGELPSKVLEKGLAGPGLLADLIDKKLHYHLPLYRQEELTAQLGWSLARSTQSQWLGACAELLEALVLEAKREALQSAVLHTDDTPVRVLEPGNGKTREGRMWVYVGDENHPQTVYQYSPNRKREHPAEFLKGWRGTLVADAYGGYEGICAGAGIVKAGCWAHARRKFDEAQSSAPREAAAMLERIGQLYAVEAQARPALEAAQRAPLKERGEQLAAAYRARLKLRQELSAGLVEEIRKWLLAQVQAALPKSPLGTAVRYALEQWETLVVFLRDGAVELDNNVAENALRPIAIGRKNWLFVGSDNGGRALANLYTLTATCRRHGVDVYAYLKDVLVRIEQQPPGRLHELLPQNWQAAQQSRPACAGAALPPEVTPPSAGVSSTPLASGP